jgi:hypothetical protein
MITSLKIRGVLNLMPYMDRETAILYPSFLASVKVYLVNFKAA